jgi:hypothetical protein
MYPQLEPTLYPDTELEINLEVLWKTLCQEILDRKYANRTHGHRRTYDAGCHGPACSRASRDHVRRRSGNGASEYYLAYDAIVAYWYPIAITRVDEMFRNLVDSL